MRARLLTVLTAVALAGASAPAGAQSASGALAGSVTDADGVALAGVCVEVYGDTMETAVTDDDGAYLLEDLPAGSVLVGFNTCEEPLAGYAAQYFEGAAGIADATPVEVPAGGTLSGIDAALRPGATVAGTVTGDSAEDTDGLFDACVTLLDPEAGLFHRVTTGSGGVYAAENLNAGSYLVLFEDCSDPYTYLPEIYEDIAVDGSAEQIEPTLVTVAAGEQREGVDAALTEGGSVTGTVTALHTGRPLPLACVALYAAGASEDSPSNVVVSGFRPDSAPEETPGDYTIPGVRQGSYTVAMNSLACGDDGYLPQVLDDQLEVEVGQVVPDVDAVAVPSPSISFACLSGGEAPGAFPDVAENSVHRAAIDCLAGYGVTTGRADGTYGPEAPVSRAQMATFVVRALQTMGVTVPAEPADAFSDDDGNTHELSINQLAALGVVGGTGDGRYRPNQLVPRAQMATFLVAAYEKASGFELIAAADVFADDDGSTHEGSIDKAATAALTAGTGQGTFAPAATVQRDQMATFLARLIDRVQRDVGLDGFTASPEGSSPAAGDESQVEGSSEQESLLRLRAAADLAG